MIVLIVKWSSVCSTGGAERSNLITATPSSTKTRYKVARPHIEQPEDGSIRYIPLTQDQVAIVDAEDYDTLREFNWFAHWSPGMNSFYAIRDIVTEGSHAPYGMHRAVMDAPKERFVDHINHNTLDNRRANLRLASPAQNQANTRKRRDNASGYKGVCWEERRQKWVAQIQSQGRRKHVGYFSSPEEAGAAYKRAAEKMFGAFAVSLEAAA